MPKKGPQKTIGVSAYARQLGVSPQVIYQRIAVGNLKRGRDWVYETKTVRFKRIIIKK